MEEYFGIKFMVDFVGLLILIIYLASGTPSLIYLKIFFYFNLITIFHLDDVICSRL